MRYATAMPCARLTRLSLLAQGFGGGTRIGGNLAIFNRNYAKRLVSGRSVVIILSDGYDTDPPELIGDELARLKQRGCRIIWLNPLKGWKDYEPVARGMAAAFAASRSFRPRQHPAIAWPISNPNW